MSNATNSLDVAAVISAQATFADILGQFPGHEDVKEQIDFNSLPESSRATIIRVGLTNMLRDSMAGKASDPVEARQALVDKIKRVVDGTLGTSGPRASRISPEERERNAYLDEVIARHCKGKGIAAPKGKEQIAAAREKVYAANQAKVDAEVKRRLKAAAVDIDLDL